MARRRTVRLPIVVAVFLVFVGPRAGSAQEVVPPGTALPPGGIASSVPAAASGLLAAGGPVAITGDGLTAASGPLAVPPGSPLGPINAAAPAAVPIPAE